MYKSDEKIHITAVSQCTLHIGLRDGGQGAAAPPPIRAVCRHEFGQRVDIIRAKHNTCLNNRNLGSVTGVNGKKHEFLGLLLELTEKLHRIWIPENLCYYPPPPPLNMDPGKFLLLPPPPTESIRAKLGLPPPQWMLARTPMTLQHNNSML